MEVKHIQLPNNTVVDINDSRITGIDSIPVGDSTNVITSGGVYDSLILNGLHPLESNGYGPVLATTSNYNTLFPFFQAIPYEWDEPVVVHYRVRATVYLNEDLYNSIHECRFVFFHDSLLAYSCNNYIGNTSYKNIYYNSLMRCTPTYKDMGHLIGFNYYSNGDSYSRKCTTSGYGRTFTVDILYIENCYIEWVETCTTVASAISGYVAGTTHYDINNYNATTQGESHSGDVNSNSVGYIIRNQFATRTTTDKFYRYRLLFSSADNTQWVPSNTSTSTNATATRDVNQRPINPFGYIVYYDTTTVLDANAVVPAGNAWRQNVLTFGYSFNRTGAALSLTFPAPVYLKCALQSDGSAIIDSTTPYVQTLPSTEDGKIYIYLGRAYSATNIELEFEHPIYYYKGGKIYEYFKTEPAQTITVDSALSSTSENPVQNKVINTALGNKADSSSLAAVATSGSYNDLSNKPTIPSAPGTLVTNATTAQTASSGEAMSGSITLHKIAKTGTYSDLIGTPTIPTKTSDLTNDSGFITGMTILSYGSSTWQDFLDAYNANKVVYCRASSNANPGTGTQGRMAFMAYVGFTSNAVSSVEFQYYRSVSSHTSSQQGDQVFIYTLKSTGWTVLTREASTKVVAGTGLSSSYSSDTITITCPNKEVTTNKVTSLSSSSTDTQYPSAKCVYNKLADKADTSSLPAAATATPVMDGTGAVGTSAKYAKEDHVHPSDTTKENSSNKVTSLSSSSTDTQYPSAKCVYDIIGDIETLINAL